MEAAKATSGSHHKREKSTSPSPSRKAPTVTRRQVTTNAPHHGDMEVVISERQGTIEFSHPDLPAARPLRYAERDGRKALLAKDVAALLEIELESLPREECFAFYRIREEVSPSYFVDKDVLCMNEMGLFRAFMKSGRALAKEFLRWAERLVSPSGEEPQGPAAEEGTPRFDMAHVLFLGVDREGAPSKKVATPEQSMYAKEYYKREAADALLDVRREFSATDLGWVEHAPLPGEKIKRMHREDPLPNRPVILKSTMTLPAPAWRTANFLWDPTSRTKWDKLALRCAVVDDLDKSSRVDYVEETNLLPGHLPRNMVVVAIVQRDVHARMFVIAYRSVVHKKVKVEGQFIRAHVFKGGFIVREVDERSCELTYVVQMDVKGVLSRVTAEHYFVRRMLAPQQINYALRIEYLSNCGKWSKGGLFPARSLLTESRSLQGVLRKVRGLKSLVSFLPGSSAATSPGPSDGEQGGGAAPGHDAPGQPAGPQSGDERSPSPPQASPPPTEAEPASKPDAAPKRGSSPHGGGGRGGSSPHDRSSSPERRAGRSSPPPQADKAKAKPSAAPPPATAAPPLQPKQAFVAPASPLAALAPASGTTTAAAAAKLASLEGSTGGGGLLATLKPRLAGPPPSSSLPGTPGSGAQRPNTSPGPAELSRPSSFSTQPPAAEPARRPSTSDGVPPPPAGALPVGRRSSTAASLPRTYSGTSLASTVLLVPQQAPRSAGPKRPTGITSLRALLDASPVVFDGEELEREERRLRRKRRLAKQAAAEARAEAAKAAKAAKAAAQAQAPPAAAASPPGLGGVAAAAVASRRMSRRMSLMKLAELAANGTSIAEFLRPDSSPQRRSEGEEESSEGSSAEEEAANSAEEEDQAEEERMRNEDPLNLTGWADALQGRKQRRRGAAAGAAPGPGTDGKSSVAKGLLKSGGVGARLFRKYMAIPLPSMKLLREQHAAHSASPGADGRGGSPPRAQTAGSRVRVATPLDPVHQAALNFAHSRAEARRLRHEAGGFGLSMSVGSLASGFELPTPTDVPPGLRYVPPPRSRRASTADGPRRASQLGVLRKSSTSGPAAEPPAAVPNRLSAIASAPALFPAPHPSTPPVPPDHSRPFLGASPPLQ